MTSATELWVDRSDLRVTRIEHREVACSDGEALLEVERFALTANNITYAVAGDSMNYWTFFPAPQGWGRVPVWGFGRVVASKNPAVQAGQRFYGYFPMGTHLVVRPERVGAGGFVDASPHRAGLAAVYNQYLRAAPASQDEENAQMLLRPLFMTSFLLDDFLADNDFFGARSVILSSASSKTAIGLAFELSTKRRGRAEAVGLTSPGNATFVKGLGYYARCVEYGAIESLDPAVPSVFVDMAGNGEVLRRVHEHFGDALRHSCLVGATHWEGRAGADRATLPGPAPALFFAPAHIQKRNREWGPGGVEKGLATDWQAFVTAARAWLKVENRAGPEAMRAAYLEMLGGRTAPDRGVVIAP